MTPGRRFQLQVSERRSLLMIGDTLAILLAVLLSLGIWALVDPLDQNVDFIIANSYWFPILAGLWLLLANANDFYSLRISARIDTSLITLFRVTLQMLVIYLAIFFISPRDALPRLFILYHGVLSSLFIVIWRALRPYLIRPADIRRRALIVGTGLSASTIIETLRREAPDDYELVGLISDGGSERTGETDLPVVGTSADLLVVAERDTVSEIILAFDGQLSGRMLQAIMDCYERGLSIVPMPLLYEQVTGRVPVEHVGQQYWTTVLPIEGESIFDPYPLVKRLMDIGLSLVGLALFAPLFPLIILIMRLDSPGPIVYRQQRVGRGGKTFTVFKLRSMIPDAERHTGPLWATHNDPRITRVGRILRRTRLDEVPQLANVLRGEMSLIGPRPERPEFVAELSQRIPFYRTRNAVKPGVTGWAQVRYRYGSSEEDALIKLQYDLYYIRHRSLALDLLIILRTVGKIISFQGT